MPSKNNWLVKLNKVIKIIIVIKVNKVKDLETGVKDPTQIPKKGKDPQKTVKDIKGQSLNILTPDWKKKVEDKET